MLSYTDDHKLYKLQLSHRKANKNYTAVCYILYVTKGGKTWSIQCSLHQCCCYCDLPNPTNKETFSKVIQTKHVEDNIKKQKKTNGLAFFI